VACIVAPMVPRTGRPPVDNPRRIIRRIRLSDAEDASVVAAAEAAGQDVAEWMRDRVLAAAKRVKKG